MDSGIVRRAVNTLLERHPELVLLDPALAEAASLLCGYLRVRAQGSRLRKWRQRRGRRPHRWRAYERLHEQTPRDRRAPRGPGCGRFRTWAPSRGFAANGVLRDRPHPARRPHQRLRQRRRSRDGLRPAGLRLRGPRRHSLGHHHVGQREERQLRRGRRPSPGAQGPGHDRPDRRLPGLRCDICLQAPETETWKVQELHLPIYHALCLAVESTLFP